MAACEWEVTRRFGGEFHETMIDTGLGKTRIRVAIRGSGRYRQVDVYIAARGYACDAFISGAATVSAMRKAALAFARSHEVQSRKEISADDE